MVLVFGGTTEGRRAVEVLEEAGTPYYYSTRGREQSVSLVSGRRIAGAMDVPAIETFCREHAIRLIVDAAHPFAEQLHHNLWQAAQDTGIPLVRYERIYPPHTDDITWCRDYEEAVSKMQQQGIGRLLALTGVQTIGRLRRFWQQDECWMRILDREQSREIARREGFPEDHLVYYSDEDEQTRQLIEQLRPQAILTKESGLSGGFCEKVEAAKAAGVKVFVVERPYINPPTSNFQHLKIVNGPHGLRRMVEHFVPDFFPLKTGLTTGTCATAAAIAAVTGEKTVSVLLPNGEDIEVEVSQVEKGRATVVKQAGDDPDITDGLEICVTVEPGGDGGIEIRGGEGVGRVTLPGLGLPIGAAAINEVPQQMIRENLLRLNTPRSPENISRTPVPPHPRPPENISRTPAPSHPRTPENISPLLVTISVPKGREIARQTFNPRIGVVDGISIIGTSGIVRPLSSEAWISSIRKEMAVGWQTQQAQTGSQQEALIVINSGARSERFLRRRFSQLPEQAFVHYGNFIGETLQTAHELGVSHVVMGVMIGKAVKLAEGHVNTHSHEVTMNRTFLLELATEAGIDDKTRERMASLNMARELWDLVPPEAMSRLAHIIAGRCHRHCAPLLPNGQLQVLLISEQGDVFE